MKKPSPKRCRRCNRILTQKECIEAGLGETCAKKLGITINVPKPNKKSKTATRSRSKSAINKKGGVSKKKKRIIKYRESNNDSNFNPFQLLIPFKENQQ